MNPNAGIWTSLDFDLLSWEILPGRLSDLLLVLVTGLGAENTAVEGGRIAGSTDRTAGAGCENGEKVAPNPGALWVLFGARLIFLSYFLAVATVAAVCLILGLKPVEPLAAIYLMVLVDEILFFLSLETV